MIDFYLDNSVIDIKILVLILTGKGDSHHIYFSQRKNWIEIFCSRASSDCQGWGNYVRRAFAVVPCSVAARDHFSSSSNSRREKM